MIRSGESERLLTIHGNVAYVERNFATLSRLQLEQTIELLHSASESCGYATSPPNGEEELGVILFCGFLERFRTVGLLRHLNAGCVVVQDPLAPWFTGSAFCGGVDQVLEIARKALPQARRWLLLGQSSGGYAALRASRLISPNLTLAFAPQTFDDSSVKTQAIRWPPEFSFSQTMNVGSAIQDLRPIFFSIPSLGDSTCCIISAFSEHGNPPTEWIWLDAMHWGRLVDHPDVTVFVTPGNSHPVLLQAIDRYSKLVADLASLNFSNRAVLLNRVDECVFGRIPPNSGLQLL